MKVSILPPTSTNFQLCYLPQTFQSQLQQDQDHGNGDTSTTPENYIALPLHGNRRLLLRCSLRISAEDGSNLICCDTRVQQLKISPAKEADADVPPGPGGVEGKKTACGEDDNVDEFFDGDGASQERRKKLVEDEEHHDPIPGEIFRTRTMTMADEIDLALASTLSSLEDEEEEQHVPSSVRFNDALACTSKHVQILKSGAIKMMRLTVICQSDLHWRKKEDDDDDDFSNSNGTTPKDSNSTSTTFPAGTTTLDNDNDNNKPHSSATFDFGISKEEDKKSPSKTSSHSHQHSNHNHGKWNRLQNKILRIFQTYDIHIMPYTLVDLRTCPLASSVESEFSPKVSFVFVEECEMRNNNKNAPVTTTTTTTSTTTTATIGTIGRVTGRTEIIIGNVHHISYYDRLIERELVKATHLFGLEEAAKILRSAVLIGMQGMKTSVKCRRTTSKHLTEFSFLGILISGPSGCGKTLVVRETARKVGANLLSFNPLNSSEEDGDALALTKIFHRACVTASRYPTILFFPRIHLLFQKIKDKRRRERILLHLCKLFDSVPKEGVMLTVVASTDKSFLVPMELRRAGRLEKEIIIYPPKESDRVNILRELCPKSFEDVNLLEVARQTPGYVAQDLVKLVRLALFKCQEESSSRVDSMHVKYALSRVLPSVLEGAMGVVDIERALSLDHIAGLHSVKLDLIKAIVWPLNHPSAFRRMGISPPKGILLYGPPGNCKTTLVRALASQHHTNFLSVSAAELFASGVGDSEKIVAGLFHRARTASPCILFIDELESIVGSRQGSEKKQTSTNESILSMLLTEMDGVGVTGFSRNSEGDLGPLVLVVAATNRPDLIDPALLRPGRFDKLIPVPPLDFEGRLELLKLCSKSIPFHDDVDFEGIASDTEYYSGADLVNLCKEAAINALTEDMGAPFVKDGHLKQARSLLKPSLSPAIVQKFYEYGKVTVQ